MVQVVEHLGFKTSQRDHLFQVEQTHHQVSYATVSMLFISFHLIPAGILTTTSSSVCLSLTYSCDGHHLYTANSEGTVMAWCRRDQQRMKLPMFYSFLSSYAAG